MSNSVLGIRVKASADFSDVTREGAKAAREVREQFSSPGKRIGWVDPLLTGAPAMGGRRDNPQKAVESLTRALDRTHQAGRRLRDIQLPLAQFGEAEKKIKALERRIAMLGMTPFGKDLNQRIAATGTDRARPFQWDWEKMYGSRPAGDAARQKFYQGAFAPARVAAPVVGAAAASGGGLSGLALLKGAAGPMAALAGIGSAVSMLASGYRDHLKVIESVDAVYKATASERGFAGLTEDARALGHTLQMASAEASVLARQFVSASGALDASAFGRAGAAGQFGRGYGMDPSASTGLFARAELVGVGSTRSSQREFARTIAQTIGGSGMFARSEQVMGDLVGRVESIATSQGRTVGSGELGGFAAILQSLYTNPAMRGGGAGSVLSSVDAMGGRGGLMQEAFAWQSFGDAVGGDAARVRMMQEASAETSPFDLFGEGYTKRTRMELAHEQMLRVADMMPGTTAAERYAFANSEYGNSSMQIGQRQYELAEAMRTNGIDYDGFSGWLKGASGRDVDDIEMSGLANLSRMYGKRGDRSEGHVGWMRSQAEQYLAGGNVPSALAGSLRDALDAGGDPDKLETLLPQVMAAASAMGTRADHERQISADFSSQLEELTGAIHPVVLGMKDVAGSAGEAANALKDMVSGLLGAAGISPGGYGAVPVGGALQRDEGYRPTSFGGLLRDALSYGGRRAAERGQPPAGSGLLDAVIPPAGAGIAPPASALQSGASGGSVSGLLGGLKVDTPGWDKHLRDLESSRGLPPGILSGIEHAETGHLAGSPKRNTALSKAGALGRFQFMPGTAARYGLDDPTDPVASSYAAADSLKANAAYLKKHGIEPTMDNLLASYNAGEGAVRRHGGVPPFKETQSYVPKARAAAGRAAGGAPGGASRVPGQMPGGAYSAPGMAIRYAGDPSNPYSTASRRAKPFDSIVMHHAEGGIDDLVQYGKTYDKERGGRFGYHFYIDRDGNVVQGAPMDKRTNHIKPNARHGTSNASAIGISLVDGVDGGSPEQLKAAEQLGAQLRQQFGIDAERVWGHGEIQGDKMESEGREAAARVRAANPDLSQASPRMPPALYGAIAPNNPGQPTDARWQGQVAMDVTFRTDRGAILQRRHALAVSEPRVAGSGGSAGDSSRFSWNDSVTMPAVG